MPTIIGAVIGEIGVFSEQNEIPPTIRSARLAFFFARRQMAGYTLRMTTVPDLSGMGTTFSGLSEKKSSIALSAPSQYKLE
jgi:hypothetical protein